MHGTYEKSAREQREIDCQLRQGTARIVSRSLVKGFCKLIWPRNTEQHVAVVCGCSERTAYRILSGEIDIPGVLVAAINVRLTKRD